MSLVFLQFLSTFDHHKRHSNDSNGENFLSSRIGQLIPTTDTTDWDAGYIYSVKFI